MEILRVEWETGYMELSVKAFFPCNLQKARKIAPLINRYCTKEDRAALLSELRDMVRYYQQEIQEEKDSRERLRRYYAAMGSMAKNSKELKAMKSEELKVMKRCETKIKKNEALKKRAERNIDLIEGGKKK